MRLIPDPYSLIPVLQPLLNQETDQVDDAVGVAPLVVVPAQHLDAVADDLGERRIDDGGEFVAFEVGGCPSARLRWRL